MALNIPNVGSPGSSLIQGLNSGSNLMHSMMLNKYYDQPHASGDVANAMYVQQLRNQFGENDPRYIEAKRAHDMGLNARQSLMDYRKDLPQRQLEMSREKAFQQLRDKLELERQKSGLQQTTRKNISSDIQNEKKAQQLEDTADTLMQYAHNNEKISDILDRNKNVTGNLPALRNFLNLAGEDVGEFNNLAIPMQGQLAKNLSSRGGAVVSKLAAGGKYNLSKSHDYNKGIRESTTNDIINTHNTLNERYKRLTGKDLPQKLSHFYENWKNKSKTNSPSPSSSKNIKWNLVNGKLVKE